MKQEDCISKIQKLLIQFATEVKDSGKSNLNNINVIAEDVLVPILSIVWETDLINLNTKKSNYPGIDLATDDSITVGCEKKKIAFQITSTNTIEKIKKTLKGYVKNKFYEQFDEIYIYNLVEKQPSYQKASVEEVNEIVDGKFQFDLQSNILDRNDLFENIKPLTPFSKIEKIHKLLEDQFVYQKKSLLSLEIWESEGKVGYGFSNLLQGIDQTVIRALVNNGLSGESRDVLEFLLNRFDASFAENCNQDKADKFQNLGFNTYLKAGFAQALKSFGQIKDTISGKVVGDDFDAKLSDTFKALEINLDESDFPLVNSPESHPAIQFIKETVKEIFRVSAVDDKDIDAFVKDFNLGIESAVISAFGEEDYKKHKEGTRGKWLQENEKDLLLYMKSLEKLGLADDEELQYQETFGLWKNVHDFNTTDENERAELYRDEHIAKIEQKESGLSRVEDLIEEYFRACNDDYIGNILFLIADFGKGKSCFLKYLTAKLAKQYLKTHEGYFPVYLNLNEYEQYKSSASLGAIAYYLAKKFKVDITDDYLKKKKYFFLIDSLDECGELSETNIDSVIKDISEIQNLDICNQRQNRIVVTSRPIAKGLREQITKYKPFRLEREDCNGGKKQTDNYISVYGFKKEQFNAYVHFALKRDIEKGLVADESFSDIAQNMISAVNRDEQFNLYEELLGGVLQESELRRPIFAYMIYKLIVSGADFVESGKVGLYLSFINHLTRNAKHKDDCNTEVCLKDEFVYRNILHASALLWQYKRESGEQTAITKADICRTIEEKPIDADDRQVLKTFPDVESVHFLSHSYFGEKDNTLHFQHQSFAEILLAEYYLKIFIKYAFDKSPDIEEVCIKLSAGLPTDQTVEFFKGLLQLLRECVLFNEADNNLFEKKKLLLPLLISIATEKHNKNLYSERLYSKWFEYYEDDIFNHDELPEKIINDFPVKKEHLDKIEAICREVIISPKKYLLGKSKSRTVLFDDELIELEKEKFSDYEIEKWLALVAGNAIVNDFETKTFFNGKLEASYLFGMIKNWNFHKGIVPIWSVTCFIGIDMNEFKKPVLCKQMNLQFINFSYSHFRYLIIEHSILDFCCFLNVVFEDVSIDFSSLINTAFMNVKLLSKTFNYEDGREGKYTALDLSFCFIEKGVLFPEKLNKVISVSKGGYTKMGTDISVISHLVAVHYLKNYSGLFEFILAQGKSVDFIMSAFQFEIPEHNKDDWNREISRFRELLEKLAIEVEEEKNKGLPETN